MDLSGSYAHPAVIARGQAGDGKKVPPNIIPTVGPSSSIIVKVRPGVYVGFYTETQSITSYNFASA
jgi:hypothetical protein